VRPRFYVPGAEAASASVALPDDEAEHLARVLRLGAGEEVEIFDGRGRLWRAEVVQAGKKSAVVRLLEPLPPAREAGVAVTLVMCVLKGDKMDAVVRDAVMLGVAAIRPVVSERAETSLAALARGHRVERWQRIAVASAKQCRRAVVPPIFAPVPLEWYWTDPSTRGPAPAEPARALRVMCVEPAAGLGDTTSVQSLARPAAADVIVGPEGGWTVAEVAAADAAGAILMRLGARTLRADAVPLVALSALLTTWGEL
jgi:16S rRNA (uracil1498-N3)-methyltransferase